MAILFYFNSKFSQTRKGLIGGRRGRDHVVVGFTTTCAISAYHSLRCEIERRSWRGVLDTTLCDKVSDLRQVGYFLRVLRLPPPIKLTATI